MPDITCALLIPHPHEPRLLLHADGGVWRLPAVSIQIEHWMEDMRALRPAVHTALGLDATALRRISVVQAEEGRPGLCVFDIEVHGGDWARAGGVWLSAEEAAALAPADERVARVVAARLGEAAGEPAPAERAPWARPGWYAAASAWIARELVRLGRAPLGAPVQHQATGISAVLRAPTEAGDVYFKQAAALPLFCHEPRVMAWLAERAPELVPAPLAADEARRWMLLADLGTALWSGAGDEVWRDVARRHARLQRELAGRHDELLAAGCVDRRLHLLPAQLAALAEDAAVGLTDDDRQRLRAALPRIAALCQELIGLSVPQTLVHADLHGGNIVVGERAWVIDWTDACVSHPFFDLLTVVEHPAFPERLRPGVSAAYLDEWRGLADEAQIARAWELARPAAWLHLAVSYQGIVAGIERSEGPLFDEDLPFFLRLALETLER